MRITVETKELDGLTKFMVALHKDQLPFAMMRTLNDLAEESRSEVVDGLPSKFTLRKAWWKPRTKYGFNVAVAKKTNLVAEVFTKAPWMISFEKGETRHPAGKAFAVPTANVKRSKKDLITSANRPRNLKGAFVMQTARGPVIFQRVKTRGSSSLLAMYGLEGKADIKPTLQMGVTVKKVVDHQFIDLFTKRFKEAVSTAKR